MSEQLQTILRDFITTLSAGVLAVLGGFLISLAKQGASWVSEKVQSIKDERVRKDVDGAVSQLQSIITTTITSLQQTLGDEIRKSLADGDGKYTKEDLTALKDSAIETIKHQLTSSTKELLTSAYENFDDFLADLIEATLRQIKLQEKSSKLAEDTVTTTKKLLNE